MHVRYSNEFLLIRSPRTKFSQENNDNGRDAGGRKVIPRTNLPSGKFKWKRRGTGLTKHQGQCCNRGVEKFAKPLKRSNRSDEISDHFFFSSSSSYERNKKIYDICIEGIYWKNNRKEASRFVRIFRRILINWQIFARIFRRGYAKVIKT